jgi:hypothetical protein
VTGRPQERSVWLLLGWNARLICPLIAMTNWWVVFNSPSLPRFVYLFNAVLFSAIAAFFWSRPPQRWGERGDPE